VQQEIGRGGSRIVSNAALIGDGCVGHIDR